MDKKEIQYLRNTVSEDMIYAYFLETSDFFIPNLLSRVKDLRAYANKIKEKAEIFEAWHNECLIGIVAAYFNDFNSKIGFVTIASVKKQYYGKEIAKRLLTEAMKYGKEKKFIKIKLEVNRENVRALAFYTKMNFKLIDELPQNNSLIMELSLEKT